MEQEGKSVSNFDQEMRQILSEFLAGVVELEGLAKAGNRFLSSFQQALDFLRRPSIHEKSDLVQNIIKKIATNRVKSYVEAGCVKLCDDAQSLSQMHTSLSGLHDHLVKAKPILCELETFMDNAGILLQCSSGSLTELDEQSELSSREESEQDSVSGRDERRVDAAGCASAMAIMYSMMKQDYLMQERIVCSLGLKSSSEELNSYCLMWSLRPFVNDDIIHEAVSEIRR